MNQHPEPPGLSSKLLWLAWLCALVAFGLLAGGPTLFEAILSLTFAASLLLLRWLWHVTLQRSRTAPRLKVAQRLWNAAAFVAWMSVMAGLIWLWRAGYFDEAVLEMPTPATDYNTAPWLEGL